MKLHKLVLALGLVFSGGMLLSGCSDGSSSASVPAEVPAISSKIKYQFVFVDSTTGTAITDPLNVTFTGAVALTAADGTAVTKDVATTTSDGFVAVGADFTSTNTEFSVLVGNRTLGWIETGTRVVGAADLTGEQVVTISLVNTNKAAAINSSSTPIAMAVADGTADATGKIAATVVANTTPKTVTVTTVNDDGTTSETSTTVGTAALTVPANTVGKTADGTPASGALKVSSTYFSNADSRSMDAFPGGFATSVNAGTATLSQLGGASSATGGSFVTGGFAQFNITDSSGKAIKNFDPPVEVGIDLPKGTKNADGTAELKVGDEYPVWSFDDATGSWKFEKMGTVAEKDPVDPKNFTVKFPTSHLSSWNLDFYVATCTGHLNLTGRNGDARPLTLQIQGTSGRTFSRTLYGVTDSAQTFLRYPMGTKVAVKVFDGSTLVGAATNLNLCSGGAVALSLPVIARGSLQVNTYEACANGTRQRAVPAFVYAYSSKNGYSMGYTTKATATSTVATKLIANQKVDTFTVGVFNPRTYRYEFKYNVPVTANNTTTLNYGWTMTCPSGGGN